jgi:hypothetical protein
MIISRENRYVFVELPRTGSTAVQKELLHNYAGERILQKHATYRDYLRQASDDEKRFFAFSSIRNPLDDAVSRYYKLKTDHHGRYTDPIRLKYRVGRLGAERLRVGEFPENRKLRRRSLHERLENRKYRSIRDDDLDFSTFFLRFYRAPYDNWSRLDHERLDYVIRFENLEEDFTTVLEMIGLEPKRPLPRLNRTAERPGTFVDEYSPAAIRRATWVFGPYMERWGYELPAGWEDASIHPSSRLAFRALAAPRRLYWQRLRAA